jgi:hypothetical protein
MKIHDIPFLFPKGMKRAARVWSLLSPKIYAHVRVRQIKSHYHPEPHTLIASERREELLRSGVQSLRSTLAIDFLARLLALKQTHNYRAIKAVSSSSISSARRQEIEKASSIHTPLSFSHARNYFNVRRNLAHERDHLFKKKSQFPHFGNVKKVLLGVSERRKI